MAFDLHICKSDSKEGCRYDRADEGCTVTAYNHNNGDMSRKHTELSCDLDQYRHQSEEEGIGIKHQCQRYSLRFYYLGEKYKNKVEHIGAKPGFDVTDTLIL